MNIYKISCIPPLFHEKNNKYQTLNKRLTYLISFLLKSQFKPPVECKRKTSNSKFITEFTNNSIFYPNKGHGHNMISKRILKYMVARFPNNSYSKDGALSF